MNAMVEILFGGAVFLFAGLVWLWMLGRKAILLDAVSGSAIADHPAADLTPLVSPKDLTGYLADHRDPGLWRALVHELDRDSETTWQVIAWMLDQPDCHVCVPIEFARLVRIAEYCGRPETAIARPQALTLLRQITRRDMDRPFVAKEGAAHARDLLEACHAARRQCVVRGQVPALAVPDRTLGARYAAPSCPEHLVVDHAGIHQWPSAA